MSSDIRKWLLGHPDTIWAQCRGHWAVPGAIIIASGEWRQGTDGRVCLVNRLGFISWTLRRSQTILSPPFFCHLSLGLGELHCQLRGCWVCPCGLWLHIEHPSVPGRPQEDAQCLCPPPSRGDMEMSEFSLAQRCSFGHKCENRGLASSEWPPG